MIKPDVIEKLKTFNDSSYQILSVYLSADSVQAPSGEYLLKQFHSLLHQHLNKDLKETFKSDITRIEEYLSEYTPSARSLIFFSAGEKLWETISLEFCLPQDLSSETSPNIDPLIQSLQKYTKYLVVLVDREKARMFTVEQGEITERSEFVGGYVPQRVKSTSREISGGDGDINFRYNEELLQNHINLAAEAVNKFTESNVISFVVIGGHAEMFKKVIKSLPIGLQKKVVGSFVTEISIPLNEILIKSKKVAASIE